MSFAEKKNLITRFWQGEVIGRPLYIIPDYLPGRENIFPAQNSLEDTVEDVLDRQLNSLNRRIIGKDDYIPCLNTCIGTYIWASAFGCEIVKLDDGRLFVKEPIIKKPEDVYRIKKPMITDGYLGFVLKLTEHFEKTQKGVYPITITDVLTPLTIGPLIWESSNFFISLNENKEEVHYLFRQITDLIVEFIRVQKSITSDFNPICWPPIWMPEELGIYCSEDTMPMVSKEVYEEFGLLYINRLSDEFGGIFLHSCQIQEEHFSSILKIKNLRGINFDLSGSADFGKIVEFFGDKIVISPHNYLRQGVPFNDEIEYLKYVLDRITDKTRLFFHVCNVMQDPVTSQDKPINPERIYQLLKEKGIYSN